MANRGTPRECGGAALQSDAVDGPVKVQQASEARFSADQAARALHRAVALTDERLDVHGDDLTLDQLVAIGQEIGIAEDDVRLAATLEWLGDRPDRAPWLVRLAGPDTVSGQQVVSGASGEVTELLERWLRVAHCMKVSRRDGGGVRWEPAAGVVGTLQRGVRSIVGEPVMDGISGMTTQVAEIGVDRTVVRVEADLGSRGATIAAATAASGLLTLGAVAGALLLSPFALLAVPVGLGAAVAIVASRRNTAAAADRAIGRMLSGVAHRDLPPTAIDAMRGRLRRAE